MGALKVLFCLGLCAVGCSGEAEYDAIEACIYGGADQPSQVRLDAGERRSVVAVYEPALDGLCSAILVAEGTLLTAKHCLSQERTSFGDIELLFGPDAYSSTFVRHPTSATFHPDVDAALLRFEATAREEDWPSKPVPLYSGVIDKSLVGISVEIAGFGRSEESAGRLQFASQSVAAVDPASITIAMGSGTGACFGDSGGPMFVGTSAGTAVLGILGHGPNHCQGGDHYVRADLLQELTGGGCAP